MIRELLNHLDAQGGATLNTDLEHADLNHGYMVSLQGHEKTLKPGDLSLELLNEYKHKAQDLGGYVGLWLEDNILYLDISTVHYSYRVAMYNAKKNNQKAIYDLANKKTIYV